MPEDTPNTFLRATGVSRRFGRLAVLRDVHLDVKEGELLLVTGYNGCGKSTLLRCLVGITVPQRGTIACRIEGRDLDLAERRLAMGYVAPDLEFYAELTTLENLMFACRLRGLPHSRARELLERVNLPLDRAAGALSSGMRQRLRWAWALLDEPRILLLDEPLQNLDRPGRRDVLDLLAHHLQRGLAVVANPEPLELPHVARHLDLGQ